MSALDPSQVRAINRKLMHRQPDGYAALRVFRRKGRGKTSPRLLIKCGDCDNRLEIYYDPEHPEDIEIAGVLGSVKNWKEILLPMLESKRAVRAKGKRQ